MQLGDFKDSISPTESTLSAEVKQKNKRAPPRKWSAHEDKLFLEALDKFGRDWRKGAEYVGTRDHKAFSSHAQKYFIKLCKEGKPLPDKVRETGDGYTLSGKPLDKNSASARAYGLAGAQGRAEYRQERKMKKLKLQETDSLINATLNNTSYINTINSIHVPPLSTEMKTVPPVNPKQALYANVNPKNETSTLHGLPPADYLPSSQSVTQTSYDCITPMPPANAEMTSSTTSSNANSKYLTRDPSSLFTSYPLNTSLMPTTTKRHHEDFFDTTALSDPSTPQMGYTRPGEDSLSNAMDSLPTSLCPSPCAKYTRSPLLNDLPSTLSTSTPYYPFNFTPFSTPQFTAQSPIPYSPFNLTLDMNSLFNENTTTTKPSELGNESNGTTTSSVSSALSNPSLSGSNSKPSENELTKKKDGCPLENLWLGPSYTEPQRRNSITCSIHNAKSTGSDSNTLKESSPNPQEPVPVSPTVLEMTSYSASVSPTSAMESVTTPTSVSNVNPYAPLNELDVPESIPLPTDADCVVISSSEDKATPKKKKNIFTRTRSVTSKTTTSNPALSPVPSTEETKNSTDLLAGLPATPTPLSNRGTTSPSSGIQLYKCKLYSPSYSNSLFNKQPFHVFIDILPFMLLEIHCHSSYNEVCGYFVGTWDNTNNILYIQSCYPRNTLPSHPRGPSSLSSTANDKEEQDMMEFIQKNHLQIVGCYHSHPSYDALPSENDISFQYQSQKKYVPSTQVVNASNKAFLSACSSPFVGCIISPYSTAESAPLLSSLMFYHVLYYNSEYSSFQLSYSPVCYNTIQYISMKTYIQAIYASVSNSLIRWDQQCLYNHFNQFTYKEKLSRSMLLRLLSFEQLSNNQHHSEYAKKCELYIEEILKDL